MAGSGERPPASGSDPRAELASAETELPADAIEPTARSVRTRAIGPGDELGRYVVGDELGAGGMATVFRARDRELRRDVAIKVLFPHLARKPDVTRRFQREARAAAALEHANILRVYDVGAAAGDLPPFIVMELVQGQTLRELAEAGPPLPAELVACIGALVCEALAVAHAAGIVHRDVKPGNVMFADDGRLLLADFGVAHLEDDDSLVTRTGAMLGTPSFMAPEQALGQAVDARSDLYAVGATLYQLATGSMPYTGSTAKIVTEASRGSAPPAVRRRPAIGTELSRLIARLMAPEPAARPATATAAARELAAVAAAGGLDDPAAELRALAADRVGHVESRLPIIVGKLVERAAAASERRAIPQALALCDRALAIAPEDPRVHALEARLAFGRSQRRWPVVLALAIAMAVGVGTASLVVVRGCHAQRATPRFIGVIDGADAGIGADAAPPVAADAGTAPTDAGAIVTSTALDGGRQRVDGGHPTGAAVDARASVPIDAAAPAPAIDAASPVLVAVTFSFDTWCNLTVDDLARGRANKVVVVRLAPGRHPAACSQGPGLGSWSRTIEVVDGAPARVEGDLLPTVEVVVAVGDEVRIDGVAVARGRSLAVKLGPHRVDVVVAGKVVTTARLTIPGVARCTLRDQPALDCYP